MATETALQIVTAEDLDWCCMFGGCANGHPYLHEARYWSADWLQDNSAGSRLHCAVDFCSQACLDGWKAAGGPQQHLSSESPWPYRVKDGTYRELVPG